MKYFYLSVLVLFFSISNYANTNPSIEDNIQGSCLVVPNTVNVSCFGMCDASSTAIANGVQPFTYQWSTGDTGSTVSGLCAGSYSVIMTDSAGCADTAMVTITEPSLLSSTIVESYLNCQCTFIPFVTGGVFPYTYLWCNSSTAPVLNDCTPGLCTVTITDANGCSIQDTILITPPPPITLTPSVTDASCIGCTDGSITANLSGGTAPFNYVLLQTGSTNSTGIFTGLAAGNYTICVTDANLCTACDSVVVNEPVSSCSVTIIGVNNILCYGDCNGSLTAVANGVPPFNYLWSNGDTASTTVSLCAGTYSVIMSDSVGCTDTAFATVSEPPPLVSSYTSDFSNCNCTYALIVNGGTPGYTFLWCDGSIGQTLSDCSSGSCIATIMDANGCISEDTVLMNPPPPLSLTIQTTGTSCIGCIDGTLTGTTTGGFPPYTYLLTPGNLICDSCTGLASGIYTLCVTDSSGCTVCVTDTVEDDPTSVTSSSFTNGISVYPNPFKNYLQVDVANDVELLHPVFELRDVMGKIILSTPLKEKHSRLHLEDIAPGIYFYQIMLDDKTEFKGRLIATH